MFFQRAFLGMVALLIASCNQSPISQSLLGGKASENRGPDSLRVGPAQLSQQEQKLFKLTSDHRASKGLVKLKWLGQAIIEAQGHSSDMALRKVDFGHDGFNRRVENIKRKEDIFAKSAAENVAQNSTTERAFRGLLMSWGHRKHIEGDYTHIGIGAAKAAGGGWYYTQIFIKI